MNRLITKTEVEDILNFVKPIGEGGMRLQIRSLEPYQKAFVQKSFLSSPDPNVDYRPTKSNERLEFLGDKYLGAVVTFYLMERYPDDLYPDVQEGLLTKLISRLVRGSMLYRLARFLGLGNYLLLSPEIERLTYVYPNKGRNSPRLYEDAFESFCGAVIEDFGDELGYRYLKRFITTLLEDQIDLAELVLQNDNHKDTLQRYFQSIRWQNPDYKELYEEGSVHARQFTKGVFLTREQLAQLAPSVQDNVQIYHSSTLQMVNGQTRTSIEAWAAQIDGFIIGIGRASNKKDAEQIAAHAGLVNLDIDINWNC